MTETPTLDLRLTVPLDRFDLDLAFTSSKRVIGIFGPSGSGKTTLLETIAGLRRGAVGHIRCGQTTWLDTALGRNLPPERRSIGYVPQSHLLFPHLSVAGNLDFGRPRAKSSAQAVDVTRAEVIDALELSPLLDRRVDSLSGGERQRVALGRALCSGPRLLMLDEPLASLDHALRLRILPFLSRVRARFQIPILIVSHNPVELLALCDEVIAISRGKLVAQGAPTDALTRSDVYANASSDGFENILPTTVHDQGEHTTRLRIGKHPDAPALAVPKIDRPVGAAVLAGIPSSDILIATRPVEGLSARNCLPATIASIEAAAGKRIIRASIVGSDTAPLVIELTADAIAELELAPARQVWLVIKTSSIALYG